MIRFDLCVKNLFTRFLFGAIALALINITLVAEASHPNKNRLIKVLNPKVTTLLLNPQEDLYKKHGRPQAIRICVIDSGLSPWTQLNQDKVIAPFNALTSSTALAKEVQSIFDIDGHGTATAGIIHQLTPQSSLIPVKSFEQGIGTVESLLRGLRHCIDQGADIINISGSGHGVVKKFILAHPRIIENTLIVMAAGNFREHIEKDPVRPHNLLLVGATTLTKPTRITSYSATGNGVDIYAPAGDNGDGIETWTTTNDVRLYNGTSAAAPVVSGIAAVILEQQPEMSIAELRTLLTTLFETF